jgi:hypothetical protein
MAKTHFASDGLRVGDAKQCSGAPAPAGNDVKGGPATRRYMDVKLIEMTSFKGVSRESKSSTGPTHA